MKQTLSTLMMFSLVLTGTPSRLSRFRLETR